MPPCQIPLLQSVYQHSKLTYSPLNNAVAVGLTLQAVVIKDLYLGAFLGTLYALKPSGGQTSEEIFSMSALAEKKTGFKNTILLVDDDAYFRFAMATELRAAGYLVQSAENGERGIRMVEGSGEGDLAIDLVITDLVMPRKDGMRFCNELRQFDTDMPVLVISGNLSSDVQRDLTALGCSDFLEKPFTPTDLLRKVEKLLRSRN
jgi:CheY-like chemotaxis protein